MPDALVEVDAHVMTVTMNRPERYNAMTLHMFARMADAWQRASDDDDVRVIAGFIEGFRKPAKLRQVAAKAADKGKPIVVMKVGRSDNARLATLAHTGSLAGSAEIVQAALRQSGIFAAWTPDQLLARVRDLGEGTPVGFQPLLGGLDPAEGWKSLKLLEKTMPHLQAIAAPA